MGRLENWKKLITNPKEGISNIKNGMVTMSPQQMIKVKLWGIKGSLFGFILTFISIFVKLFIVFDWMSLIFLLILMFISIQQFMAYIDLKQQLENINDMFKER